MAGDKAAINKQLEALIRPLRTAKYEADYLWGDLESGLGRLGADYGGLDLTPDFQRGHVWTPEQQSHFIENCLRGVVSSSGFLIQFNCPHWTHDDVRSDLPAMLQCVDGLQRYTAVTGFMRDDVKAFGLVASELKGTAFSPRHFRMRIAVHDFIKRSDLLEHYLSINAGGTPHSAEEIARVRGLLVESQNQ